MMRRIVHIDMDAFFASVEEVRDPRLRGKPVIVGGSLGGMRGVVSTASYAARRYGVHSAMPLAEARRLCPHGIFIRGDYEAYEEASERVFAVLETVSPVVEAVSIDEAYIDITGSIRLFGGEDAIAEHLKGGIREKTQLPCTVAIASNKLVAKIGSDAAKPDGYLNIPPGAEAEFLRPMGIGRLPGVGPSTCRLLESLGVSTIGCLAELPAGALLDVFGHGGLALQRAARGLSSEPVEPESIPKSIGRETTFEQDLLDWDQIERILGRLTERACFALREQQMEARCVTLKIRYADFKTHTFSRTLPEPTCIDRDVIRALRELLPKAQSRRARVRLIGVSLSSLVCDQRQLHLFGGRNREKWERAMESVDAIRNRFGFGSIHRAGFKGGREP